MPAYAIGGSNPALPGTANGSFAAGSGGAPDCFDVVCVWAPVCDGWPLLFIGATQGIFHENCSRSEIINNVKTMQAYPRVTDVHGVLP